MTYPPSAVSQLGNVPFEVVYAPERTVAATLPEELLLRTPTHPSASATHSTRPGSDQAGRRQAALAYLGLELDELDIFEQTQL